MSPWKLISMSREKAQLAADKARERFMRREEDDHISSSLRPLPLETKSGPSVTTNSSSSSSSSSRGFAVGVTPLVIVKGMGSGSGLPGRFSSPRRRFSVSPSPKQKYKTNFDLKLTEVSRELDTYISRQVLCSVLKNPKDQTDSSPSPLTT